MKVSELEGAELDYWVARAEALPVVRLECGDGFECYPDEAPLSAGYYYKFSRSWADGGPLIERDGISILQTGFHSGWVAHVQDKGGRQHYNGPTALIAAMRCFVGELYGEEVPDQESP